MNHCHLRISDERCYLGPSNPFWSLTLTLTLTLTLSVQKQVLFVDCPQRPWICDFTWSWFMPETHKLLLSSALQLGDGENLKTKHILPFSSSFWKSLLTETCPINCMWSPFQQQIWGTYVPPCIHQLASCSPQNRHDCPPPPLILLSSRPSQSEIWSDEDAARWERMISWWSAKCFHDAADVHKFAAFQSVSFHQQMQQKDSGAERCKSVMK